jgi:hypothetical protein
MAIDKGAKNMFTSTFTARILIPFIACLTIIAPQSIRADAILRSTDPSFSTRLMRHTVTEVTVDIHGLVAETRIYSEFKNDDSKSTIAVYSFPVPEDARVTGLRYSQRDTILEAELKEIPQTTVPGTGEGGFAAELNEYLGRNAVTLQINSIPGGSIQKVELCYIQKLNLEAGRITYRYPLNTTGFQYDALQHLAFSVLVHKPWTRKGWRSESHPDGWTVLQDDADLLSLRYEKSKAMNLSQGTGRFNPYLASRLIQQVFYWFPPCHPRLFSRMACRAQSCFWSTNRAACRASNCSRASRSFNLA